MCNITTNWVYLQELRGFDLLTNFFVKVAMSANLKHNWATFGDLGSKESANLGSFRNIWPVPYFFIMVAMTADLWYNLTTFGDFGPTETAFWLI